MQDRFLAIYSGRLTVCMRLSVSNAVAASTKLLKDYLHLDTGGQVYCR